jgi:glutamate 5-kinase
MKIIVKVGTSSLTDEQGAINRAMIASLCEQIGALRTAGHEVVLVSSGAVSAGIAALGFESRPTDIQILQALAAVGQSRLMEVYNAEFSRHGLVAAQVLLVPHDFVDRTQYLHARATLETLLGLGCVPVVNENDAIANDEIRFGDNDHIAALLSHLLKADLLVLLTDIEGLYNTDPRRDTSAQLINEVFVGDPLLSVSAGSAGTHRGSGGMNSKLSAARIASWSGIRAVIAQARTPMVLSRVVEDVRASTTSVGTTFHGADRQLSARQLWVAFASEVRGRIWVDDGARDALRRGTVSLLPAGVRTVDGNFESGDTVVILDGNDEVVARGLTSMSRSQVDRTAGLQSRQLEEGIPPIVVHRDSLVLLPY